MVSSSSDFPQKSLQIKKDDRFFSRLVSKEGSMANPSFRIYYGGVSGAVPFMWESQPGTPKHTFSNSSLPPLTPPPSYQFNPNKNTPKKHSRSTLLHTLFPRLIPIKQSHHVSPTSPSSLSLSSSSWSSSTTTSSMSANKRSRFSSPGSSFDSMMDEYEEEGNFESHTSTICFGFGRDTSGGGGGGGGGGGSSLRGGCTYSAMSMKKAFLSIVGHGSSKLRY